MVIPTPPPERDHRFDCGQQTFYETNGEKQPVIAACDRPKSLAHRVHEDSTLNFAWTEEDDW